MKSNANGSGSGSIQDGHDGVETIKLHDHTNRAYGYIIYIEDFSDHGGYRDLNSQETQWTIHTSSGTVHDTSKYPRWIQ